MRPVLFILPALVSAPALAGPAEDVAAMLEGRWDNATQHTDGAGEANPHLHVIHAGFDNPAIPGTLVYAQLNTGGPDGDIYRQRVYAFTEGADGVEMAAYEFADPAAYADAQDAPDRLAALTPDDLVRFDPGCDFHWQAMENGWRGAIADGLCVRTSRRSGRDMVIGGEFTITQDVFTHAESGRYADTGEFVFGPEGGVPNIYDRYEDDEE